MNVDKEYNNILEMVKQYIVILQEKGEYQFEKMELTDSTLRVVINFTNCIYELVVENKDFVPYRYIKVEILSLIEIEKNPIFLWYDNDRCSKNLIIDKIDKSIKYATEY